MGDLLLEDLEDPEIEDTEDVPDGLDVEEIEDEIEEEVLARGGYAIAAGPSASKISGLSVNPNDYPAANVGQATNEIYWFLRNEMGLNHAAACGVLGNIQLESNFSPLALGDGGTSYGICQWHLGRCSALMNFCKKNGYDYNTLEGQLYYLQFELESAYSNVYSYIQSVPDTKQGAYNAAYYFCLYFESPNNANQRGQQRGNLAMNDFFNRDFSRKAVSAADENADILSKIRKDISGEDEVIEDRVLPYQGSDASDPEGDEPEIVAGTDEEVTDTAGTDEDVTDTDEEVTDTAGTDEDVTDTAEEEYTPSITQAIPDRIVFLASDAGIAADDVKEPEVVEAVKAAKEEPEEAEFDTEKIFADIREAFTAGEDKEEEPQSETKAQEELNGIRARLDGIQSLGDAASR